MDQENNLSSYVENTEPFRVHISILLWQWAGLLQIRVWDYNHFECDDTYSNMEKEKIVNKIQTSKMKYKTNLG